MRNGMRNGNFYYELKLSEAFVVHRGVSQGGKKLSPEKRLAFWQKNSREMEGIEISDGKITVSLSGLRALREKSLVIVSNPRKPRVWTVKRIKKFARKIRAMEITENPSPPPRRGGLKL